MSGFPVLGRLHGRFVHSLSEAERIAFELAEAKGYASREVITLKADGEMSNFECVNVKGECGCA